MGAPEALRNHAPLLDEIALDRAATANNIRMIRLQPGDHILELTNQKPGHPVWPAAQLRLEDINVAVTNRWRVPLTYDPDILASTIRTPLRRSLSRTYTAILGLNFAVAGAGSLVCLDNNGHNASLVAFARNLICLVSIEQLVADTADLHRLIQAFSRSAWGRPMPAYVTQVDKPAPLDTEGPRAIHLILVDNGRSRILAQEFGEALRCIQCGACLNVCPIYQQIGGDGYGESPYKGPIGSVLNPILLRPGLADDQPYLSSNCNACRPVCPVDIDLPRLLHEQRVRVAPRIPSWREKTAFWLWQRLVTRPRLFAPALRLARLVQRW